ncbi:hypothetical protein MBUL_04488 (plasmid) [Methylobacterium bullatum]|uniref:Peptidase A2 domain-containing protein n=1 Tax=Methylobacterium bullatum TaxID=570505 RepID=A0A679J8G7_9HYPH|nr:hypothetical protein MBUL_04488 [Methylobacterium bullatum]
MRNLNFDAFGDPADVKESAGFQDWQRRRARHSSQAGGPIGRQPQPARGAAGTRLQTLRRDLDLMQIKAGATAPSAPSPVVSLSPASNGCFYAQAAIGGRTVPMMVDTGATFCSLTAEDAERVGIRLRASDFTRELLTQNGRIKVAPVLIGNMQIGAISMRGVQAVVCRHEPSSESLIGMSFLSRLREFSIKDGRLTLRG